MINEQSLLTDLVESISLWLEGGRGRSLSGLSRRCNVAYSTIRRIAQNESTPHPYTALAISEVVMTTAQRVLFLRKHFPTIGNLMDECYSPTIRPDANEAVLRNALSREPHNRIFNMAATMAGTRREAIARLAGQIGLEALDEMIETELLVEHRDGTIKYTHNNWAIGNIDDAILQIKHSADHFDKELVGSDGASLMHATGAISEDAIPKVKSLIRNFIRDLNTLKNKPESEGGVHFFCNLMYSLYDRDEWNSQKKEGS